jgi:two-component system, NarL family, response regulator LiaR
VTENLKLLIAEDNELLRAMLANYLDQRIGLQVVGTAANGQEAVDLSSQLQPDVVLMDVVMPVMDGIAATRIIRERQPNVKVVMLTNGNGAQADEALQAGASAYLLKMVSIDEIAQVIRSVLL